MLTEGPTQPDAQYFMIRFVSWESPKANKWQGRNVTRWRNDSTTGPTAPRTRR